MGASDERVIAHYVFWSVAPGPRRRGSRYLVTRLEGSNVVARISTLVAATATSATTSATVRAAGPRRASASGRYTITRVTPPEGRGPSVTPGSPRVDAVVVETGVDPVTSRFSGARSTN